MKEFMKASLITLFAAVVTASPLAKADHPSVHGMVLFGDKNLYVSHLPMFHAPHDYQVILEVEMRKDKLTDVMKAYAQAKSDGKTLFTLEPQVMDLTQIMSGEKTSFLANLYQGHFEKDGVKLGPVNIFVKKQILSAKLDPNAAESQQYVLFGKEGEYFAAHVIKGKPSFDSIASISAPFSIPLSHCRTRVCTDTFPVTIPDSKLPLTTYETSTQELKAGDQVGSLSAIADVLGSVYFEQNELSH